MKIREHFICLENRNKRYLELKSMGLNVHRTTSHGSLLHPQYIEDFPNKEHYESDLGNSHYKMPHSKLYTVSEK